MAGEKMAKCEPCERSYDNMVKMLEDLNRDLEKLLEDMEKLSENLKEKYHSSLRYMLTAALEKVNLDDTRLGDQNEKMAKWTVQVFVFKEKH